MRNTDENETPTLSLLIHKKKLEKCQNSTKKNFFKNVQIFKVFFYLGRIEFRYKVYLKNQNLKMVKKFMVKTTVLNFQFVLINKF